MVFCGTRLVGSTWVGPTDPAGPAAQQVIDIEAIAERVVRDIPLGDIDLGIQVDVRVTLDEATWDFGDGGPTQQGLGQRWPARTEVAHTYGTRSPDGQSYPVSVGLSFSAEYRANGGTWLGLDPIARTATLTYDVNESKRSATADPAGQSCLRARLGATRGGSSGCFG